MLDILFESGRVHGYQHVGFVSGSMHTDSDMHLES